jgi:Mor family transcriptional regulator
MGKRIVAVNEKGLRIGEDHQRAKLTDADVERIRQLHADGMGYKTLARKFDVSPEAIRDIVKFRRRAQCVMGFRSVPA